MNSEAKTMPNGRRACQNPDTCGWGYIINNEHELGNPFEKLRAGPPLSEL